MKVLNILSALVIASTASQLCFAKNLELRVAAPTEAIGITNQIVYIFHWSDGTATNGSMSAQDMQSGGKTLQLDETGPTIVGCESAFWFFYNIPRKSIMPRDLTPLGNRSVPCIKMSESVFNLVPQFETRMVSIRVLQSAFEGNKATTLIMNLKAPSSYYVPGIPALRPDQTPYSDSFLLISDGPIRVSANATWVSSSGLIKSDTPEDATGVILIQ
jgi:hypothetical protein